MTRKSTHARCPMHSESPSPTELTARLAPDALGRIEGVVTPRGWPLLGNLPDLAWQLLLSRGNFVRAIQRLLRKHGTRTLILRMGSRRLALTVDPKVAHRILVEEHAGFPKTEWEKRVLSPVMEGGLIILDGAEWKTHRPALASCFTAGGMTDLAELTCQAARARLDGWGSSIRVGHEMRCIGNEVMFRFFLADHRLEDVDRTAASFERIERGLEARMFDPLCFSEGLKRQLGVGRRFRSALAEVTARIEGVVVARERQRGGVTPEPSRRESRTIEDDALDVLLRKLEGTREATQEVRTTMGAGATTGHLLTWVLRLLADYPGVQARVREEIRRSAGPEGTLPPLARLEALPWLSAVIQEGLRLFPPAPFLLRQTDGIKPDMIFVSVWAMHRDPAHWERPDDFVPERWLGLSKAPEAFIPFGLGPRACVGKRFALIETRVVLFEILRRFRIEGSQDALPQAIFTILTRPQKDVLLRITRSPVDADRE